MKKLMMVVVVFSFGCASGVPSEVCQPDEAALDSNPELWCGNWAETEAGCHGCVSWNGLGFEGPLFTDADMMEPDPEPAECPPTFWLDSDRCLSSTTEDGCEFCTTWGGTSDPCIYWERDRYDNYFVCAQMTCRAPADDENCLESTGVHCDVWVRTNPCNMPDACYKWVRDGNVWNCAD